jgi:hypothetical protein
MPACLASAAATDEDGRYWVDVDGWEQARSVWPNPGWDILFTLPDEPFDPESI